MEKESAKIEDHAFLSDTETAALVSRDGCIDWLCFPRFDSGACFASLLGDKQNGHWSFTTEEKIERTSRRYQGNNLILETEMETASGAVRLVDFMPPRGNSPDIVRILEGVRGEVAMRLELIIRFDYGRTIPWVQKMDGCLVAIAGPDGLILRTPVKTHGEDLTTVAKFTVKKGERVPFVLTWFPSHQSPPKKINPDQALRDTKSYWREWIRKAQWPGKWKDEVLRSVITIKGLTYAPSGGLVAAATTSLPEKIGGVRNWDYRYCWLRDASFSLLAMMRLGYRDEARSWRQWLLRAIAGSAAQMQIMYGVFGERRLDEIEVPWLAGYESSKPVRVGNAASTQFQLDVYGEVFHALYQAEINGLKTNETEWRLQVGLIDFLESSWQKPDHGIWEMRGDAKHFTQSKVMAWLAFDRAVKLAESCEHSKLEQTEQWKKIRDEIYADVCQHGYDRNKKAFTQSYGSDAMDASVLTLPLVGFLPATDDRMRGTIAAVERKLMRDGFVLRYRTGEDDVDGLPEGEGVFLPCSFWLAACLHLIGRKEEARKLFERLLGLQNDLGLFSEEYDPIKKRQLGNFPQAFTHVAMIHAAWVLSDESPGMVADEHSKTG